MYSILYMHMYNNIHIQITQVCRKLYEKFQERWKTFTNVCQLVCRPLNTSNSRPHVQTFSSDKSANKLVGSLYVWTTKKFVGSWNVIKLHKKFADSKFPSTSTDFFERQVCKQVGGKSVRVDDEKVCRVAELSQTFVNSKFSSTRTDFFERQVCHQVCQKVCRLDAALLSEWW